MEEASALGPGVFIDVGAERDGYLHVNEWQEEGFPQEQIFARNVPASWQQVLIASLLATGRGVLQWIGTRFGFCAFSFLVPAAFLSHPEP